MNIIIRWLFNSLIVFMAAYLLPGIHIANFGTALAIALILGMLNLFVRPILIILTLPLTIVTLGFFLLVINALLVLLTSHLVSGFEVDGFWWALLFSIFVSLIHVITLRIFAGPGLK